MTPTRAITRRHCLQQALGIGLAGILASSNFAAAARPKKILLCSGWQWISIADISQTPASLRLLETHWRDTEVTLWLYKTTDAITAMIRSAFPKLQIVEGSIDKKTLQITGDELRKALEQTDLAIHGAAPNLIAPELLQWCQTNKKPFGVLGIGLGDVDEKQAVLLSNTKFAFARDSSTLNAIKKAGVKGPTLGVIPDSSFFFDLRDDASAKAFLKTAGLEDGRFFCVVPRLRFTPFRRFPAEVLRQRTATNEQFAEIDHGKLRDAITLAVRKTGMKVLACPEMSYEIDLIDKHVINPLPDDVKKNVAKRGTFWLPDEAASVFARAAAIVSFETHAAILALSAGVPAIYLHQPTEIHKAQIFRDIGLTPWVQEIEDSSGDRIAKPLLEILTNADVAKKKVTKAMSMVEALYDENVGAIRESIKG